jgi:hypothetical protein
MLIVKMNPADAARGVFDTRAIQVLLGGNPAGWEVRALTNADVRRWTPLLHRLARERELAVAGAE